MYLSTYVKETYNRNNFIFMCFNEPGKINIKHFCYLASHEWSLKGIIVRTVSRLYFFPKIYHCK